MRFNLPAVERLLATRPHTSAQLAGWLGLPRDTVHAALLAFAREGRVKRVGEQQHWALPSYVARPGRRTIDRPACRAAIRAALAARPLATMNLVLHTGYSRPIVKHECRLMKEAGELRRFGIGRASQWALASMPVPLRRPTAPPVRPQEARTPATPTPEPPQAHRQPLEAAQALRAPSAPAPSWWLNQSREQFATRVHEEVGRMESSKEAERLAKAFDQLARVGRG